MADWQTALAADGPKVAKWITDNLQPSKHDYATCRRLSDWRKGGQADFFTVDRVMVRYDRHVSEIPENIWRDKVSFQKGAGIQRKGGRPRVEITPKPCEGCGKRIPLFMPCGKRITPANYEKKTYCSRECQWYYGRLGRRAA